MSTLILFLACLVSTMRSAPMREIDYNGANSNSLWSISAADDDDFVYDNPYDTYSPNSYVRWGHRISRKDFQASTAYIQASMVVPLWLLGLGLLSFLGLLVGLCSRCCLQCSKCKPLITIDPNQYDSSKLVMVIIFYTLVFFVGSFDQLVFIGNNHLDDGIRTMNKSIVEFRDIAGFLRDMSDVLLAYGSVLEALYLAGQLGNTTPYFTQQTYDDTVTYMRYIDDFRAIVQQVYEVLQKVHRYSTREGTYYRNMGLFGLWCFGVVAGLLFVLSQCLQSVYLSQFSICFGLFTFLLFSVLSAVWLTLTTAFAGFCMRPTENVLLAIQEYVSLKGVALYYVSCIGGNTLFENVNKSRDSITQMNNTLTDYLNNNDDASFDDDFFDSLFDFRNTLNSIDLDTTRIEQYVDCSAIRHLWFQFINKGLCDEAYTGLFFVWGSQLFTAFFLFLLCVAASLMYQHYGVAQPVASADQLDSHDDVNQYAKVDQLEEGGVGEEMCHYLQMENSHVSSPNREVEMVSIQQENTQSATDTASAVATDAVVFIGKDDNGNELGRF